MGKTKSATFLKTDDNKVINEQSIRWIKKMNECLEVCTKTTGCRIFVEGSRETHRICKANSPESYHKLVQLFNG
jgi:hypothetical protein